jgi:hypothetical protein
MLQETPKCEMWQRILLMFVSGNEKYKMTSIFKRLKEHSPLAYEFMFPISHRLVLYAAEHQQLISASS